MSVKGDADINNLQVSDIVINVDLKDYGTQNDLDEGDRIVVMLHEIAIHLETVRSKLLEIKKIDNSDERSKALTNFLNSDFGSIDHQKIAEGTNKVFDKAVLEVFGFLSENLTLTVNTGFSEEERNFMDLNSPVTKLMMEYSEFGIDLSKDKTFTGNVEQKQGEPTIRSVAGVSMTMLTNFRKGIKQHKSHYEKKTETTENK